MTLEEARRTLGLGAEDDPTEHMAEFAAARERIAELVRTAPNETIALRFQDGLIDFDRALAAMREEIAKNETETKRLEWMDAARGKVEPVVVTTEWKPKEEEPTPILTETRKIEDEPAAAETKKIEIPALPAETGKTEIPPPPPETQKIEVMAAAAPPPRPAPAPKESDGPTVDVRSSSAAPVLVVILLLFAAVGGWYLWNQNEERTHLQAQERLAFLERLGAKMIDARQWPEAEAAYKEIEQLRPGSKTVLLGRRSIEAGMEEEQRQFVGYWSGEANNAFDLGRLEDASAAARKVLDKYPGEKPIVELMGKIEQARSMQAREALVSAATAAIQKRRWDEAETKAKEFAGAFPGDAQGNSLLSEIRSGREKDEKDRIRAKELLAAAKVRDLGQFDRDALEWLREAVALAPGDPEIDALYQKMASYTRTLQVPGDFKTLAEALDSARDRDRIVVAEGTWTGPLIVDKAVTLEGAGKDKTIVEVEAAASTAATFGIHAGGARVSGITFRHRGFDPGANRFSVLLVRGSEVTMNDCRIADSAGHGLAVMDAGHVAATRCGFENNGWDGVSVRGAGSRIEFSQCEATGNFGHGYDLWEGGSGAIHECLARDNSAAGILVDTTGANVVLGNNDLRGNREYGIVVSAAASGRVHGNQCRENLLGGLAVRFAAAKVIVENNVLEKNLGPGLALERGLVETSFGTNKANANAGGKNTVTNADFSSGE